MKWWQTAHENSLKETVGFKSDLCRKWKEAQKKMTDVNCGHQSCAGRGRGRFSSPNFTQSVLKTATFSKEQEKQGGGGNAGKQTPIFPFKGRWMKNDNAEAAPNWA